MTSHSDPLATSELWVIWGVVWLRHVAAIGLTILIYDTLLTMDDEVRLVWPGPLSWPNALYYVNRYLSIPAIIYSNYLIAGYHPPLPDYSSVSFHALFNAFCYIWIWTTGLVYAVRTTAATGTLCLRVVALYNDVRWVVWSVWTVFGILHGMRAVLAIWGVVDLAPHLKYSLIGGQCLLGSSIGKRQYHPTTYLAILSDTLLDLYLLILTTVKAFRSAALSKSHPSSPIMRALLRHELMYFIIITIVRGFTTVFIVAFPPSWMNISSNAEWGLESALISRFFLNLRSICYYEKTIARSETAVSTLRPTRTHPFWRRPRQLTTEFSFGIGAETSIYGDLATQNESGIPQPESVGLDSGMELETRRDEDKNDIQLDADVITMYEK